MEQNLVSDEELIERINKVLKESKQEKEEQGAKADRHANTSGEKFHDVYETVEQVVSEESQKPSEVSIFGPQKNLVLENHYLSLQLQAEKKKAKELQSKFKLFENSVKYFERLNGQLETIKRAVVEENLEVENEALRKYGLEEMQKIRPKTIHTTASGIVTGVNSNDVPKEVSNCKELQDKDSGSKDEKEEIAFRDAEDFKQLEQGLEIVKDKNIDSDFEAEKVFITKTEKRCLEDIGSIAARTRVPIDDKHQRYFERDRRKFANSITMPEVQEVDKADAVPPEIISKTKETPVNIASTELDGLRSYLLQLKELITRRETAWARRTERDYNQRVEITRFKNEVSHLRMICEKRQKDVKERDQIIASKDEEIRELQKRIQGLRNAIVKQEKKDDRLMDTIDGMTNEVLENSQIVQRSYNAMKRQSLINRANVPNNISPPILKQPANVTQPASRSKDAIVKKPRFLNEKTSLRKVKQSESASDNDDGKFNEKKTKSNTKGKPRHKSDTLYKTKETIDKVDEKLHKVEEMLHNEVLRGAKKQHQQHQQQQQQQQLLAATRPLKNQGDVKSLLRNQMTEKTFGDFSTARKSTPSSSIVRQEMLTAMTGLNGSQGLGPRSGVFQDGKRNHGTAAAIANALLTARNTNLFNYQYA